MADSSHLEKMGRELKCPICLSLLNSAVSLTCNHVFCNSCISKSMKSASNCPVCKLPYRRREMRAAPHMDNLVSIYKSMELASGINIFVTQNGPCKKPEEVEIHGDGDSNFDGARLDEMSHEKTVKKRNFKRKETERSTIRLADSNPSPKPSFPTKKRVRVPQCSLSETPTQPEKVSNLRSQSAKFQVEGNTKITVESTSQKNDCTVLKEKPVFNEKGDPVFKPFFWLRETGDDDEEASEYLSAQQMEGDCLTGTSPWNAPCFSDIKDTDDASPIKMTQNVEGSSKSKVADVFDSEMFEWTQRACSPELSLTPMKRQEECKAATQIYTSLRSETAVSTNSKHLNAERENENTHMESTTKQNKSSDAKSTKKKKIKGHKRPSGKVQSKCAKSSTGRPATVSDEFVGDVPTSPVKVAEIFNRESDCTENAKVVSAERGLRKKHGQGKHVQGPTKQINSSIAEKVIQEGLSKSRKVESQNQGKDNVAIMELPVLSRQQTEDEKSLDKENKFSTLRMRKCVRQSKNLNINTSMTRVIKEIPKSNGERMENKENIDLNKELPSLQCPQSDDDKTQLSGKKARESVKQFQRQDKRNVVSKQKDPKRLRSSSSDAARYKVIDEVLLVTDNSEGKECPVISKPQGLTLEGDNNSAKDSILSTAMDHNPQKCENIPNKIQCAFCRSGSESEASGEMLHYVDGKPVTANYNSGSDVIHSHRNCTEWAPNVYFEDDIVVNLETEIARSKRIKCSCCGVKGASLGCYEKSCRKSFHVPCAKLVPQCRWDAENFVMLCPLHSSSKLPNEIIGTQQQRRKRTVPKMNFEARLSVRPSIQSEKWKWPSALPGKWVICCSALTAAEKEIVSNFTRMVGVSESKTWSPTVTHVIASTDENGACKRTLKFLMGILEGQWILKIDWIKSCMAAMEPVSEEQFEISTDIHGIKNGPQFGRLRVMNKEPKLFNGLTFYFVGDFAPTYKGYLQNLVLTGGGIVLHRKPISRDHERLLNESSVSTAYIIYSLEPPENCDSSKKDLILNCRKAEANTLANATGAKAAGHSWILDSIAAAKLQKLT